METKQIYNTIEEKVNEKIGANYFEILDEEPISDGYIIIEDETPIEETIKTIKEEVEEIGGVSIDIDEMPSDDFELTYKFKIDISGVTTPQKPFGDDNMSDEAIYYKMECKKQKEEERIMDNAIVTDAFDSYGKIFEDIVFQDEIEAEIGGDWYCRASGGAFSSSQDYWNYILG